MLPLLLWIIAVINDKGIIHKALSSFTVVAMCKAISPYFCEAPTTELVSCIAIAAHNPNCSWVMDNKCPRTGNINRAIELSKNMILRDIDVSSSSASMIGVIAAIALPPHIAVPEETKMLVLRSVLKILPSNSPNPSVSIIDAAVNNKPLLPTSRASSKFIPNPSPTTEACNKNLVSFEVFFLNGFPIVNDKINPANKAIGGSMNGNIHKIAIMMNIPFFR